MDYLWLKALHIVAVVTWVGGMLVVAVAMGSTLTLLGAFFIFIAQVATAASGLLTLGRARLVTSAIEEHRPAAQ